MKFTDGAWMIPPGVTPATAKRVLEHSIDATSLELAVTDRPTGNRVDGTALQVRITSPMPDVIRVQARHHWPADQPAAGSNSMIPQYANMWRWSRGGYRSRRLH